MFETLFTVGENPSVIALELVFQSFTNHTIGSQKVGCRDTLSVRGIGNHDALVLGLHEVLEVSDRLFVMRQGKIVAAFPKANVVDVDVLGEYMLGIKTMTAEEMEGLL